MKRFLLSLSILCFLACGGPSTLDTQMDMDMATDIVMAPTITMIAPASGPTTGGTDVTITGVNFDSSTQTVMVRFGNNPATVKSISATQVVVTTPAGAPGLVDVVVVNGASELSATLPGGFSYRIPELTLIAGDLGKIDGTGPAARFSNPQGVAVDGAGNLYVADAGHGVIRKVVVAPGVVTTIPASVGVPQGVAVDGAGNLYVADTYNHTIRKVVAATGVVTTLAGTAGMVDSVDGTGPAARFHGPIGVAVDGAGNLYVSDTGNHTIRKVVVATGVVTTLAGTAGMAGSFDGTGLATRFNSPEGVAVDGAGNLYVADAGNNTIRKVVVATGAVTTLAGSAIYLAGSADGTGPGARFLGPRSVAVDGTGNLYVADAGNNTIRKVVVATGVVTTLAGTAGTSGSADGTGPGARFYRPRGVAVDGTGNLYVADYANNTIRKVVVATGVVTTLAGSAGWLDGVDGTGPDARFYGPQGVAADGAGNLYVADTYNHTIRKVVVATGVVTTLAGIAGRPGRWDSFGPIAQFNSPRGVAVDGAGNLFVADSGNSIIRKVKLANGLVTTFAGSVGMFGGTDGTGAAARFGTPQGMAVDGAGNLYVADSGTCTIRKVVLDTGAVTTVVGTAGICGSIDNFGPVATFGFPQGVALDGAGNLYVADTANHTIRKVVLATLSVTTLAGTAGVTGSTDGIGPGARFRLPQGIAVDGAGNLYVADTGNFTIRKVVLASGSVSTLVGVAGQQPAQPGPLPARLSTPAGLAVLPSGDLFLVDASAKAVLEVH